MRRITLAELIGEIDRRDRTHLLELDELEGELASRWRQDAYTWRKPTMTRPILLIHGLFGSLADPHILAGFGKATVFVPDLLGYGAYRTAPTDGLTMEAQADHVFAWLRARSAGAVHVVGHSIGGAVATFFAARYPDLTQSLTSIEGNFTLKDAFWSSRIARMELEEVEAILDGYKADVTAWIDGAGVVPTPWAVDVARTWLSNQPASTLRAQARALVAATGNSAYLGMVRRLLDAGLPIHLIGGERSRHGWDVPQWVLKMARSNSDIAATGHLMMLEAPDRFAAAIAGNLAKLNAADARGVTRCNAA